MARFSHYHTWLVLLHQGFRSLPRRWPTDRTPSREIGDGVPSRSLRVPPNALAEACRLLPDDEVLSLIGLGHQQALAMLYERHAQRVFSLALYITADRMSAEKVTEDVFVLVWQRPTAFRSHAGTVWSAIAAMTRNQAIDTLPARPGTARHEQVTPVDTVMAVPSLGAACVQPVVVQDMVREALRTLPVTQRQAIDLAYYGGLTAAEIASVVHAPVGTIKSRLRLAMATLRQAVL